MALQDTYIVAFVVRGVDTRGANGYEAGGEIPIKTLMNALADLCQTRSDVCGAFVSCAR